MPQATSARQGQETQHGRNVRVKEQAAAGEAETFRAKEKAGKEGTSVGAEKEKPAPSPANVYGHEDFAQAWGSREPAFVTLPDQNPYGMPGGFHSITPGPIGSPPQIAPVAPGTNLSEQWNLTPSGTMTPEMMQQLMIQYQISQMQQPQFEGGPPLTGATGGALGSLG